LWQRAEASETRKNAQLAREVVVALPHELDQQQRIELVRDFVERNFVAQGMIADVALHAPEPGGNPRNFHAHILLTMRDLSLDGFEGHKRRDWNKKELLQDWREDWAKTTNRHLERAGRPERIDHRSNEERGIDREPEPKLGPIAHEIEKSGRRSLAGDEIRAVRERNLLREIHERGDRVIDTLLGAVDKAQHPLAKEHAVERVERMLDRIDSMEPSLPRNAAALAHDRLDIAEGDRAARHVAGGLSRAADSALDLAGGFLSFFEPGGSPQREPRETAEERIERLASIRDEIRRIEDQEIAKGRAYVAAREQEDERGRERERERDRLK
jgi:ATP-dependent exoDNAse (exonuclease V) alpha subunit